MHSVSGLVHSDHCYLSPENADQLDLTAFLTGDVRAVEKKYRLAVFNVLVYNRDNHAGIFSFLMGDDGELKLSPPTVLPSLASQWGVKPERTRLIS